MAKLPIVEGVLKYLEKQNTMFCMPGHKGGNGFKTTDIGLKLYKNYIKADITEVEGMDNLHHPDGIIKEAEEKLSEFYKSKKSYFLVNGSTSGNMSMIFSAFNEGEKIIVERNCHRSIFNSIILRKLKPVYVKSKICKKFNAPLSIDEKHLIDQMDKNSDAKGIIITYPNYYGICSNLKLIIEEAHKRGMMVLVDSAHGAHFGVNPKLPESAVNLGADFVVMSSHKTLPSLTQTAYLHVGKYVNTQRTDFYVSLFLSTSPSYMLMCSMDYARYFLEKNGFEEYEKLINLCNYYKKKINLLDGFHVICYEDISPYKIDDTRFVLQCSKKVNMYKLNKYLLNNKIQPEMCDGNNIVFIFSPFNESGDFEKLYNVLKRCDLNKIKGSKIEIVEYKFPKMAYLPYEVLHKETDKISYTKAAGRVCGNNLVPYPPGIPIVIQGEIIDIDTLKVLEYYIKGNETILGMDEKNDIMVVK
ncbi:MAG: aminotransferase class V-fold PLP-dependent enzyme [Clostridium sp.]|nr:aminotransferase class V-fold PLP-dependent enzyme [Clostridium sp.]